MPFVWNRDFFSWRAVTTIFFFFGYELRICYYFSPRIKTRGDFLKTKPGIKTVLKNSAQWWSLKFGFVEKEAPSKFKQAFFCPYGQFLSPWWKQVLLFSDQNSFFQLVWNYSSKILKAIDFFVFNQSRYSFVMIFFCFWIYFRVFWLFVAELCFHFRVYFWIFFFPNLILLFNRRIFFKFWFIK